MAACVAALAGEAGVASAASQTPTPAAPEAEARAFEGNGMWIWYVSRASGGDAARIAARARRRHIDTVYIKSGDGTDVWSQFTPGLVRGLQSRGLHVCAWQFVYGSNPKGEARVGAEAADRGAECLVIDAEAHYEGRYAAADTYIHRLRARLGNGYPLALASFPYVHYHPGFPYSVFLGPGGAEFNLPQVYWRAIGEAVDKAIDTTYIFNRVFERPIYPLGQLYMDPPARDVIRFRAVARADGFEGVSWWSWQHATARGWRAAARPKVPRPKGYRPPRGYPTLERGAKGDLVVWAQEHLADGGFLSGRISGEFGNESERATRRFQVSTGLPETGVIDAETWQVLLEQLEPTAIHWRRRSQHGPSGRVATARAPASASLPPLANELAGRHTPGTHD